jgi:hypothetical protein
MSFNALVFSRSQYLRDTTGVSVPSDAFYTNVVALVRTNPEFVGGVSSYNRNFTMTAGQIQDSTSPTTGVVSSSPTIYNLSPNSPYTANYPTTDSVYSVAFSENVITYLSATSYNRTEYNYSGTYPPANTALTNSSISSYNTATMPSALNIGVGIAGGFTLECWVYVPSTLVVDTFLVGAQHSLWLSMNANRTVTVQYAPFYSYSTRFDPAYSTSKSSGPDTWVTTSTAYSLWNYTSSATLTADSWNHVAVTCNFTPQLGNNTGSVNLFINGTRVGQLLNPTVTIPYGGVRTPYTVGATHNAVFMGSSYEVTGIRFIAGTCLSVDSFTLPTSKVSSNLTGWNGSTNTFTHTACFVTHFSTNGVQVPLIDYSKYRNTIVGQGSDINQPTGSISQLNLSNPTTNLKAILFNGTSSYPVGVAMNPVQQRINSTNSVLGLLSGQNFTINFFFYRTAQSADFVWTTSDSATGLRIQVGNNSNMLLRVGSSTTDRITCTGGAAINTWYYVQFSRTNNTGTSRTYKLTTISSSGTVTSGTDYTATTATDTSFAANSVQLFIGSDVARTTANIFNGYIVDYRVTAGTVRPTPTGFPAAFHPTVAPT